VAQGVHASCTHCGSLPSIRTGAGPFHYYQIFKATIRRAGGAPAASNLINALGFRPYHPHLAMGSGMLYSLVWRASVTIQCLSNTWGHGHGDVATIEVMAHASVALPEGKEMGMRIPYTREGERPMRSYKLLTLTCGVSVLLLGSIVLLARAQSVAKSDIDLARQGALALAAAHSEQPRYAGIFSG